MILRSLQKVQAVRVLLSDLGKNLKYLNKHKK